MDERGILNSISSKNEYNLAISKLKEFRIDKYFIYPQISWNSKASSVKKIAELINIGIDTFAFVDDQPFEREEVKYSHLNVLCIDAVDISEIPDMPEMIPRFITAESKERRKIYQSDIKRKKLEEKFEGPGDEFLSTLDMEFTISEATEDDLQRAEELTMRTHQLNTTGYTYSYDELNFFRQSSDYKLLISGLDDKYGTYGKIGVTLIKTEKDAWYIKLLLMSCRVMARGVGNVLINYLMQEAKKQGVRLCAELIPTDRNRMMYMTYKFANFKEKEKNGDLIIFENDLSIIQKLPNYIKLVLK